MVYMKASDPLKLCIANIILLLHLQLCETKLGGVVISPPTVAPVCSGDLLELRCTTAGSFLEWSFFLIPDGETTARKYARVLHSQSPATSELTVSSITFTFSRISTEGSEPLTSMLLIDPVSDDLNGTEVNCTDVIRSNSTSTHIQVINESVMISGKL